MTPNGRARDKAAPPRMPVQMVKAQLVVWQLVRSYPNIARQSLAFERCASLKTMKT
jgi:hypothetical protein